MGLNLIKSIEFGNGIKANLIKSGEDKSTSKIK